MKKTAIQSFWLATFILSIVAEAKPSTGKVVWDDWYTVTVGTKIHYGYYEERVEIRNGDEVFMKNEFWKQEDFINREDLGVAAKNDDVLTPLFFNFHSVYRTTETTIDGTVRDGKFLHVRAKQGGKELPIEQRSIPAKVFFSSLFPYWLGKHLGSLQENKPVHFATILEDNIDLGFSPVDGQVKLEKPDDFANEHQIKKVMVDTRGMRSTWWVDDRGAAVKIEMPDQKVTVERSTAAKAKKFLNGTI